MYDQSQSLHRRISKTEDQESAEHADLNVPALAVQPRRNHCTTNATHARTPRERAETGEPGTLDIGPHSKYCAGNRGELHVLIERFLGIIVIRKINQKSPFMRLQHICGSWIDQRTPSNPSLTLQFLPPSPSHSHPELDNRRPEGCDTQRSQSQRYCHCKKKIGYACL